ncbi:DUF6474 family protein [Corynebacterium halotolerans]|uniref:Uncharacterized protein n=1 Tax=Corynebacterium halotolerans YIM 70093 = DSM 44683 TaxID=1121362 RepID=M1NQK8_9CORY|nr:DUF6474 family protein [Corynebacterium halotolerans]AGF73663.1 hypothetical protein A605_13335 [Corynebacterium halotolerans YIM 70093 = DSM 44683]
MGILEKIRKSRARTKAEIKAAKVRARQEAKEEAKLQLRREKLLVQQENDLLKAEKKGLKAKRKHQRKMAENALQQVKEGKVSARKIIKWSGTARVALPIVLPLVYRGVTAGREQLIAARARKLGVTPDQLAEFAGHGAPLKARIQGVRDNLEDTSLMPGFVRDVNDRLDELSAAVDNAEYMTPEQRRRAHDSVSRDIDQVTQQIQERLRQR